MNTIPDIGVHDALGRHGRVCFPFPWITDELSTGPGRQRGDHLLDLPQPRARLQRRSASSGSTSSRPARRPGARMRHGWLARIPATTDEERAGYDELFATVHAAVRDEDFAMLPQCGDGIRNGQHDHMLIGRNEIGVQHVVKTFAAELGLDLGRRSAPLRPP